MMNTEIIEAGVDPTALTPEEETKIAAIVKDIDINDSVGIITYGAQTQSKLTTFSDAALQKVKNNDLGEVGKLISGLVVELKGFKIDQEEKGIVSFFKKLGNNLTSLQTKYNTVEANVDKIVGVLEGHEAELLKDVALLDKMYDTNLQYFKELSVCILAGRKKLEETMNTELKALQDKAAETGLQEDAQAANNLAGNCNRFDKRLHDLELTRTIAIQIAPQIRMIQQTDTTMVDKIHSSITNTIPLWKSQMVLALSMIHSKEAIKAQTEVSDITNKLLNENAEMLRANTIDAARESERGIVEVETLQHTNEMLISTLDEIATIQQEGREKRRAAESQLRTIENDLKNKLLEMRPQ
jgi:uncharacterized protein YaaN involved in tellurite resistance